MATLEQVILDDSDAEFADWKAAYEGLGPAPVAYRGRWFVPKGRRRRRAPRGTSAAYTFFAEAVPEPAE